MGFFDLLFGGGKNKQVVQVERQLGEATATVPIVAKDASIHPEVLAAIAAAIYVIEAPGIRPEVVAVITAAVYAAMGTNKLAIRIAQTGSMWTVTGRQKLMDTRQRY
jgi:hypothetical protein